MQQEMDKNVTVKSDLSSAEYVYALSEDNRVSLDIICEQLHLDPTTVCFRDSNGNEYWPDYENDTLVFPNLDTKYVVMGVSVIKGEEKAGTSSTAIPPVAAVTPAFASQLHAQDSIATTKASLAALTPPLYLPDHLI